MPKKPIPFKRVSLEVFSIVFAVLLALMLDAWQEKLKVKKQVHSSLQDIASEIASFTNLQFAIDYNSQQLQLLDSMLNRHQNGHPTNLKANLVRPEVRSLAWQISIRNGVVSRFNNQTLIDITEVYIEFDRLEKILAYNREFSLKSDPHMPAYTAALHNRRQLKGVIFRSEELLSKAEKFLQKYQSAKFVKTLN